FNGRMAASQAAHEGSIPFTRFYFACRKQKRRAVVPRLRDGGGRVILNEVKDLPTEARNAQMKLCDQSPYERSKSRLAAEEFLEGLEEFVRDVTSFFPEVVQFLRELHLFAAVDFATRRGNFVRGKIEFVGGAGCLEAGGRKMI